MKFTAKIGRNLRYMSASQTMVLLRSIVGSHEIFRDHAWVELNTELEKLLYSKRFNRSVARNIGTHNFFPPHQQTCRG